MKLQWLFIPLMISAGSAAVLLVPPSPPTNLRVLRSPKDSEAVQSLTAVPSVQTQAVVILPTKPVLIARVNPKYGNNKYHDLYVSADMKTWTLVAKNLTLPAQGATMAVTNTASNCGFIKTVGHDKPN